jgi:hypothetical protein
VILPSQTEGKQVCPGPVRSGAHAHRGGDQPDEATPGAPRHVDAYHLAREAGEGIQRALLTLPNSRLGAGCKSWGLRGDPLDT